MTQRYENQKIKEGYKHVIGCDEVGRGCLAGPVVAAAVVLDLRIKIKDFRFIKDSKKLVAADREYLSKVIKENAVAWSIGEVSSEIIDEINIHNASLLAMRRSVEGLLCCHCEGVHPTEAICLSQEIATSSVKALTPRNDKTFLYVDGKFKIPYFAQATKGKPDYNIEQEAVIGGDDKVLSVAAASIVAKVYRDELMQKMHLEYPVYNFAQHKGYATFHHRQKVLQHGLSSQHRISFCSKLVA